VIAFTIVIFVSSIGSVISGRTCAHAFAPNQDMTVYEAADYIGGHTHTVQVEKEGEVSKF
jgi:predicted NAD/FAD-binding protein